jgi:hypothetical protein
LLVVVRLATTSAGCADSHDRPTDLDVQGARCFVRRPLGKNLSGIKNDSIAATAGPG